MADDAQRDPDNGRFLAGNRFWTACSSAGRKPVFSDPEKLWAACVEYFEWVEANPLYEDNLVTFRGAATHEPIAKMRAMSIAGLCTFLDISRATWARYRSEPALLAIVDRVEAVIWTQKFEGAAADLLNPNVIVRELGLADRSEQAVTTRDGDRGDLKAMDDAGLDAELAKIHAARAERERVKAEALQRASRKRGRAKKPPATDG